jgi:hypothetical protein
LAHAKHLCALVLICLSSFACSAGSESDECKAGVRIRTNDQVELNGVKASGELEKDFKFDGSVNTSQQFVVTVNESELLCIPTRRMSFTDDSQCQLNLGWMSSVDSIDLFGVGQTYVFPAQPDDICKNGGQLRLKID